MEFEWNLNNAESNHGTHGNSFEEVEIVDAGYSAPSS
jgi:uncharacterized DUF497 family protein